MWTWSPSRVLLRRRPSTFVTPAWLQGPTLPRRRVPFPPRSSSRFARRSTRSRTRPPRSGRPCPRMVSVLDSQSFLWTNDRYALAKAASANIQTRIGMELALMDGDDPCEEVSTTCRPTIVDIYPNSPAETAGLQEGDVLVELNGPLPSDLNCSELPDLDSFDKDEDGGGGRNAGCGYRHRDRAGRRAHRAGGPGPGGPHQRRLPTSRQAQFLGGNRHGYGTGPVDRDGYRGPGPGPAGQPGGVQ